MSIIYVLFVPELLIVYVPELLMAPNVFPQPMLGAGAFFPLVESRVIFCCWLSSEVMATDFVWNPVAVTVRVSTTSTIFAKPPLLEIVDAELERLKADIPPIKRHISERHFRLADCSFDHKDICGSAIFWNVESVCPRSRIHIYFFPKQVALQIKKFNLHGWSGAKGELQHIVF